MADGDDVRLVVLADTHLRTVPTAGRRGNPVRARWLPVAAVDLIATADAVLHAGDLLDGGVLDRLSELAPTWAVLGNNDPGLVGILPVVRTVRFGGVEVGMIHDAGPSTGRASRLRRRFPSASLVVFGHSHVPCDEEGIDGQRLLNPGSPTQRRAQPHHTLAVVELGGGLVRSTEIVRLD